MKDFSYQIINDSINDAPVAVKRSDGWQIPINPDNSDYREYLLWLDKGNTPEPAEVRTLPPPLTAEEKLARAGLTVDELKELLGLDS